MRRTLEAIIVSARKIANTQTTNTDCVHINMYKNVCVLLPSTHLLNYSNYVDQMDYFTLPLFSDCIKLKILCCEETRSAVQRNKKKNSMEK